MRSDTLHGQLLCAAAELDGQDAVTELITAFESDKPPFICSSALPEGMLPMPCLPPLPRDEFRARFCKQDGPFCGDRVRALNFYKAFRKLAYVPIGVWSELRSGLDQASLFKRWVQDWRNDCNAFHPKQASAEAVWQTAHVESHNSIDRATGGVLQDGGLFLSESTFFGSDARLDLYVRAETPEAFERLLGHVAATGFGRDTSTGKGWFTFERDDTFDPSRLKGLGTHRMTLSVLSAMDMSEAKGWYRVFAKSGRVWGALGEGNPFKKTFLAMAEGSVFESLPDRGYVLRGLHPNPKVVQVTWPVTIAFTLATQEAAA
ncbi:type III-A CRISPR-associated RAMP protein Csm4 [Paucidesulfovibrio longus]|uniref:type III-A CRISPR-associated RAMP protein Csm4 n=1 Tax=Paucidesulfovibrio longus TaxID=889 RepID=UPI0012DCA934|nr:hypothetical protein [Paucidesulfovibrio longus]